MKRIPQEYTAQDHLYMAEHFNYNVSTDLEEVAARREQRGKHANIIDDQSAGIEIGKLVLRSLDDDREIQREWAHLYGGTMLNSSLYMFRGTDAQPMSRRFRLPKLMEDGSLRDSEEMDAEIFSSIDDTKIASDAYADARTERAPTSSESNRLARRLGNTSMLIGIVGTDFYENDDEYTTMVEARNQETIMHRAIQSLAQQIGVNPSLAQLRAESTPLGAHVMQSREYPIAMKKAFREALAEVSDEQGY